MPFILSWGEINVLNKSIIDLNLKSCNLFPVFWKTQLVNIFLIELLAIKLPVKDWFGEVNCVGIRCTYFYYGGRNR